MSRRNLGGRPLAPRIECKATGCPKAAIARGVCRPHYDALRAGRPVDGVEPWPVQRELQFPAHPKKRRRA